MALYCGVCGNGLREFRETCDAAIGCKTDCSMAQDNFTCTDSGLNSPSVCSCFSGYGPSGSLCLPICGNALVHGNEVCDDGGLGGCLSDCKGSKANFTCIGGNATSPSICSCNLGYQLNGSKCLPICGDGIVIGDEKCDDKLEKGCKEDCSGPS
jgi:hypothetical protein